MTIVSTKWLSENLDKVKIIDCSWHLPNENRNAKAEFNKEHISNAIFFDLDDNSNKDTDLPHMMPNKKDWEQILSKMGISNNDNVIVYDYSNLISSCRCWFSFLYFGHDKNLIHVLNGGMSKWKSENLPTSNKKNKIKTSRYTAKENLSMIKNINEISKNIDVKEFKLIDARSKQRFEGKVPEPRKDVRSGSIPNSYNLPFGEILNENHTFKDPNKIINKFNSRLNSEITDNVVFSCGSGVTATVLALAYSLINNKYVPKIYDGSWAEYGKIK